MSILIPEFSYYIHIAFERNWIKNPPFMSNYKTVEGKKLSTKLLDEADRMVEGAGDGRISLKDAEVLLAMVMEDNVLTNIERDTIDYISRNYHWTPAAEEWFNNQLQHWQRHKAPTPITLEELAKMHFPKTEVLADSAAIAERRRMLLSATSESATDHDEIGIWVRLQDGTTVQVLSDFFELEGDFVQLKGGCLVPVRAIEKVEI